MSTLREWSLSKLVNHQPHPFSSWCECCEQERSSDLVKFDASNWRYMCDACQRDWESEHAAQEDFGHQQAAE